MATEVNAVKLNKANNKKYNKKNQNQNENENHTNRIENTKKITCYDYNEKKHFALFYPEPKN